MLAAAVLAAVAVSAAAGAAGARSSGTNVLVVMNPSKRAISTEVRHVKEIFRQVSALPALWFFGIYEQRTRDDGAPFDRPFVFAKTPAAAAPPKLAPLERCSEQAGTAYQRGVCKKKHEATRAENAKRLVEWRAKNRRLLAGWRKRVLREVDGAGRATEESKRWDLAGALSRAATDLGVASAGGSRQNCLVLLGGLAVQPPPTRVRLSSLEGANIVVTGWRSTAQVQTLWTKLMERNGATIEFLPSDVTDFVLKDAVSQCVTPSA